MKTSLCMLLVFTIFYSACKPKEKVKDTKTPVVTVDSSKTTPEDTKKIATVDSLPPVDTSLVISFYSPGNGTDGQAKLNLEELITKFEKDNDIKLNYAKYRWGREGELDVCFNFKETDAKVAADFIAQAEKLMALSTKVRFGKNMPCTRAK